jgi:hypothetical protein
MLEKAGDFYERMHILDRALDCFLKVMHSESQLI